LSRVLVRIARSEETNSAKWQPQAGWGILEADDDPILTFSCLLFLYGSNIDIDICGRRHCMLLLGRLFCHFWG
jgi:hypothetical protein